VVLLIDGETASAAEVFAGALKENRRARLVGQRSFGKSYTQIVIKLPAASSGSPTGGLRVTVARFLAPTGASYTPDGVVPHVLVPAFTARTDVDPQLEAARREAERLISGRMQ
jgi:carboxyl-terminal processing protease